MRRMALALGGDPRAWMWGTAVAAQLQPDRADIPEAIRTGSSNDGTDRIRPGCAVGVSHRGAVVYTKGFGMASLEDRVRIRPDTIFEAGSVAKQFTAAAIILLALDGKLSLDDPVRRYVPELPDFGTPILIRHFLTHTSGLRDQWPMSSWRAAALARRPHGGRDSRARQRLQGAELHSPATSTSTTTPPSRFSPWLCERVSGRSFDEFCQERLFKPLGMKRTRWRTTSRRLARTAPRPIACFRTASSGRTPRSPTSSATAGSSRQWAIS